MMDSRHKCPNCLGLQFHLVSFKQVSPDVSCSVTQVSRRGRVVSESTKQFKPLACIPHPSTSNQFHNKGNHEEKAVPRWVYSSLPAPLSPIPGHLFSASGHIISSPKQYKQWAMPSPLSPSSHSKCLHQPSESLRMVPGSSFLIGILNSPPRQCRAILVAVVVLCPMTCRRPRVANILWARADIEQSASPLPFIHFPLLSVPPKPNDRHISCRLLPDTKREDFSHDVWSNVGSILLISPRAPSPSSCLSYS